MNARLILTPLATILVTVSACLSARAESAERISESRVAVGNASLYVRTIGSGSPIIVVHGGPDFDHSYLLPDLDRLADRFRLVYYDQRGRGKSAEGVRPDEVSLASDVEDIEQLRKELGLESPAILGHSWGAVLALEYALRHPTRVSRLILMNPAPVSKDDVALLRKAYLAKLGTDMDRQREILHSAAYQQGDPEVVTARYRIHFTHALERRDDYEKLMAVMKVAFARQEKSGIVKARAVEDRLMQDTWEAPEYNLLPKLGALRIPALVLTGEHDFIPVEISQHIAQSLPASRLAILENCGHFAYLERPDEVRKLFGEFFERN